MSVKENPLIPMGAITGKPDRKTIADALESFRNVGMTQYLIYPRSGCELEYLAPEWFDTYRIYLEEAERLGYTSIWLYDEFNWPSGQCGGRIMKENPDHALKYMQILENNGSFEFHIGSNPAKPDVLNPEAIQKFIQYTHEQYAKHFGHLFGKLIKGIFSDEPSFYRLYADIPPENERLRIPYYPGLEEDYAALTGSSLRENIIFCLRMKCAHFWKPVMCRLLGKRLKESFFEPIRNWCAAHNLLMTGHLMEEFALENSSMASGDPMEISDSLAMPGVDEIFTKTSACDTEWITFGTIEHAVRKNQHGGFAELFALGPSDMTLAKRQKMIRIVSMFGIDHYLLAVAQLNMRGNAKITQYFAPTSAVQPWFPAFKQLAESAAESAEIAKKRPQIEIQIRRPVAEYQLLELLIQLVQAQRQWALIDENEPGTAPVILTLEHEGILAEYSSEPGVQHKWQSFSAFIDELQKSRPLEIFAANADGTPASDIFLRHYEDGSVEVVNLAQKFETRSLLLHRNGQEIPFELEYDGVHSFNSWKIELDRKNIKRLIFESGKCRIFLKEKIEDITLMLRNYASVVTISLDGTLLPAEEEAQFLPPGFAELYTQTAPFTLDAGEHTLEIRSDVPEFPYLPSVFIAGMFAELEDGIARYRSDGKGLIHYIGKVIQSGVVDIPVDASFISMETDGLYTEVFLDDESIGMRSWAPFSWKIPERFIGQKVQMRIERYSSCGPMFGSERFRNPTPTDGEALGKYQPSGKIAHPVVELNFR